MGHDQVLAGLDGQPAAEDAILLYRVAAQVDCRLVLVGDGPERERIVAQIAAAVGMKLIAPSSIC